MALSFWRDYHDWILGLGTLIVALCAAMALHRAGAYVAGRIARRTPSSVDHSMVRRAHNPARALILLFAFLVFLPSVPFPDRVSEVFRRVGVLLLTASLGWLVANLTGVVKDWIAARFDIHNPDNLRARQVWTQTLLLHRFALGMIIALTVCIMLMNIPGIRQVGVSLFASAGVAGIVLGMAAQQVLKNVIAGIQSRLSG